MKKYSLSSSPSTSHFDLSPVYQQQLSKKQNWTVGRKTHQISFSGVVASLLLGNTKYYLNATWNFKEFFEKAYFCGYLRFLRLIFDRRKYCSEIVRLNAAGCQISTPKNFLEDFNTTFGPEILDKIFQFLPSEDQKTAQLVCRQWKNLLDARKNQYAKKQISSLSVSYNRKIVRISKSSNSLEIFGGSMKKADLANFGNLRITNMDLSIHGVLDDVDILNMKNIYVQFLSIYFYNGFQDQDRRIMQNFVNQLAENRYVQNLQLICFGNQFPTWFETFIQTSNIENVQFRCY
ncbi:unnamed protein product [Caenorhabditis angaria]|uniref:F-box domain-containing protein n=1 Tax=Caenorhabditis angaria TaxID=860376 RepID=A0A9P1N2M3_9PELO|nr:unnamed protein product [Caenorhabditis angaria]